MKTLLQTLFFFLLTTQICFAQWVQVGLNDKSIKDIAVHNSNIFAVTTDNGSLYRSTDNGITWLQIVATGTLDIVIAPFGLVYIVLHIDWGDSLFRSSDNGDTWVNLNIMEQLQYDAGPTNVTVNQVGFVFCRCFYLDLCGQQRTYLALSTDDGTTWTSPEDTVFGGDLFDFRDQFVISSGYCLKRGSHERHVYLSSDNGLLWSLLGEPLSFHNNVLSMCLNGNILIGGSAYDYGDKSGLFLSSDSCKSWTQVSTLIPNVGVSLECGGMLIGTDSLGVFLFSDNGDSLGTKNEGLTNLNVQTLTLDNNGYVYAGTGNGVWRRPLSEIIVSTGKFVYPLPSSFILFQNFPNPFNPSTKISWQSPVSCHQSIKVFNALGTEIASLVDEYKPVGRYEVEFDASVLPSGVYFYQLKAGDFIETKKMILLK